MTGQEKGDCLDRFDCISMLLLLP